MTQYIESYKIIFYIKYNIMENEIFDWIKNNNGYINKIIINTNNDGYYLVADEDIQKNDLLIKIPKKLCIYDAMGAFGNSSYDKNIKFVGNIAYEIRNNIYSYYNSYIKTFHNLEYYNDHPLEIKNYENWIKINKHFVYNVCELDKKLKNICQVLLRIPLYNFTYDEIKHAFYIYTTRKLNEYLIPLIDLIHHNHIPTCKYNFDDEYHYVYAITNHNKGNNLYIEYMVNSNFMMLSHYNICYIDSSMYFYVDLKNISLSNEKKNIIKKIYENIIIDKFTKNGISNKFLQFMRICNMRDIEIKNMLDKNKKFYKKFINNDIENKVNINLFDHINNMIKSLEISKNDAIEKLKMNNNDIISIKLLKVIINMYDILEVCLEKYNKKI